MKKVAIILCNLGGPDSLNAVRPFLFNLFYDKAIIRLPNPLRWIIAQIISRRRTPVAQEIYSKMGGKSPIKTLTDLQALHLENSLKENIPTIEPKVFTMMRYWHPFAYEVKQKVEACGAQEVWILPLYPQFSTTTTNSSFTEWKKIFVENTSTTPTKAICCYPTENYFIMAHVEKIQAALSNEELKDKKFRLLFSAHGLPESIIKAGDPYQWQVEQTVMSVVNKLDIKDVDYRISYQSRVGPVKWIGPNTEDEIKYAGEQKISLIVVPIAFVSEHSETLVELDIEYRHLAEEAGVPFYHRVPALAADKHFIASLTSLAMLLNEQQNNASFSLYSSEKKRICDNNFSDCPCLN